MIANQSGTLFERDSEASRERALQAAREKRKQKLEDSKADTSTASVELRTVAEGGHSLERLEHGWWCATCRTKAANWSKLAPHKCRGVPEQRWEDVVLAKTQTDGPSKGKRQVVVSYPIS